MADGHGGLPAVLMVDVARLVQPMSTAGTLEVAGVLPRQRRQLIIDRPA